MLVRSFEGPSFLLLEGDNLSQLRDLICELELIEEAILPLSSLLDLSNVSSCLERMENAKQELLSLLVGASNWNGDAISDLVSQLRDVSIACTILSGLLDCSRDVLVRAANTERREAVPENAAS